jgi:predicted transcriptional regulator of viral defense system
MTRRRRGDNLLELADLAADQAGLFTAAQAGDIGVTPKSLNHYSHRGHIERVVHGVYRIAGAPFSRYEELRALWLAIDPHATAAERLPDPDVVVSHRSAALLHDLGDLDADVHEFTAAERRQTRRASVRIHRATLDRSDITVVDGLPVTTVSRTVDDLAAGHLDGGHLAGVVRDAVRVVPVDQVESVLRRHAHRYGWPIGDGHGLVTSLIDGVSQGSPSRPIGDTAR